MSSRLVNILRQIPPAGSAGFEGLIAKLLEALTGQRFSLALSGGQAGRDMSSREPYANIIAVECKRYGQRTELKERELLGELMQVVESIPDLDVWVLVASRGVSSQLAEVLRGRAAQFGVEFLSLSSGDGSPSSLEVLCAVAPELVIAHPGVQAIAQAEEIRALLNKIAQHSQLQQRAAALRTAFVSPLVGYENWRAEQNRWFINCVTSESEARANFGQPIKALQDLPWASLDVGLRGGSRWCRIA